MDRKSKAPGQGGDRSGAVPFRRFSINTGLRVARPAVGVALARPTKGK